MASKLIQKQSPGSVLQKRYSQKFLKTDWKKPVSEFFLLKKNPTQVFSYRFWEIFKNTSFTKRLRWLLLPILKPLDSQTQWCRWISELVTIYFILTFLALVGIFVSIFGEHKLYFHISTAMWLRKCNVFALSRDHTIEVSRDVLDGAPSSWVSTLPSFGCHRPCE